jgi:hypothetical protein
MDGALTDAGVPLLEPGGFREVAEILVAARYFEIFTNRSPWNAPGRY